MRHRRAGVAAAEREAVARTLPVRHLPAVDAVAVRPVALDRDRAGESAQVESVGGVVVEPTAPDGVALAGTEGDAQSDAPGAVRGVVVVVEEVAVEDRVAGGARVTQDEPGPGVVVEGQPPEDAVPAAAADVGVAGGAEELEPLDRPVTRLLGDRPLGRRQRGGVDDGPLVTVVAQGDAVLRRAAGGDRHRPGQPVRAAAQGDRLPRPHDGDRPAERRVRMGEAAVAGVGAVRGHEDVRRRHTAGRPARRGGRRRRGRPGGRRPGCGGGGRRPGGGRRCAARPGGRPGGRRQRAGGGARPGGERTGDHHGDGEGRGAGRHRPGRQVPAGLAEPAECGVQRWGAHPRQAVEQAVRHDQHAEAGQQSLRWNEAAAVTAAGRAVAGVPGEALAPHRSGATVPALCQRGQSGAAGHGVEGAHHGACLLQPGLHPLDPDGRVRRVQ